MKRGERRQRSRSGSASCPPLFALSVPSQREVCRRKAWQAKVALVVVQEAAQRSHWRAEGRLEVRRQTATATGMAETTSSRSGSTYQSVSKQENVPASSPAPALCPLRLADSEE